MVSSQMVAPVEGTTAQMSLLENEPMVVIPGSLTTTGIDNLDSFKERVGRGPIPIISFGDSMADSYRSIPALMIDSFVEKFGVSGYALNNYGNKLLYSTSGGVIFTQPDNFWFLQYWLVPPDAELWWYNQSNAGGNLADQMGIFFVREPNCGLMSVSISTNGGPFGEVFKVDGYSDLITGDGCFTNIALPLDRYRISVKSITGTNRIIGSYVLNSTSNGVQVVFADKGGIPLSYITRVPRAIREPVFSVFTNAFMIWHMKEDGSATSKAGLNECESWWSNSMTGLSVAYIGTPWLSTDTNGTYTLDQNALVRSEAVAHQRAYIDLMNPAVSYEYMVTNGYMADTTHLNVWGSGFLAPFFWYGAGFHLIGASNNIASVHGIDGGLAIAYYASPQVSYTLQTSSDIESGTWSDVGPTRLGVPLGGWVTNTITNPGGQGYFRLRLSP
jgi:hypothetical protein